MRSFKRRPAIGTPPSTQTQTTPTRKKIMTRMNELLNRRSYIRNLVVNVQKELS